MKGQDLTPICPHCGQFSYLVTGKEIYPHRKDLYEKKFYHCKPCDAYVGTHSRTGKPLGTLANAVLRLHRNLAHAAFDPLWKTGSLSRTAAYAALAKGLNIKPAECHIAMFNSEQCKQVIQLCQSGRIHSYVNRSTNSGEESPICKGGA